jgi:hypothetical protein
VFNQHGQTDSFCRLTEQFQAFLTHSFHLKRGVEDHEVALVQFENISDEVHVAILNVNLEV